MKFSLGMLARFARLILSLHPRGKLLGKLFVHIQQASESSKRSKQCMMERKVHPPINQLSACCVPYIPNTYWLVNSLWKSTWQQNDCANRFFDHTFLSTDMLQFVTREMCEIHGTAAEDVWICKDVCTCNYLLDDKMCWNMKMIRTVGKRDSASIAPWVECSPVHLSPEITRNLWPAWAICSPLPNMVSRGVL